MFGCEVRGKFPEIKNQPKYLDDSKVRNHDRKTKEEMKICGDKRRHTAVVKIQVEDTVLCRKECKNSLKSHYDPVTTVVIGFKGSMITGQEQPKDSYQELHGLEVAEKRLQGISAACESPTGDRK